jgi:CheY-like chemotaxis protein/HPt (histidine-containing phosphotransfer) domain-containing protein
VNREVIKEQLRLLGYACEMAEDGVIALEKWRSGHYALLLTDCHMPNMDGFELTDAIRADEGAQSKEAEQGAEQVDKKGTEQGKRAPIIAVTANAMQGEAERCRERGMDDYLAKPLRLNELAAMLAKWMPLPGAAAVMPDWTANETPIAISGATPSATTSTAPSTALGDNSTSAAAKTMLEPESPVESSVWDINILTKMVGDKPAMHRRLLEKFLSGAEDQVRRIVDAALIEDTAAVGEVAHALKSAARTVGALQMGELCEQLNHAGRIGDASQCRMLSETLPGIFAAAAGQIRKHLLLLP